MEDPQVLVAALALLFYAFFSQRLGRWWISMPAAMLVIGLLAGPLGVGLIGTDARSGMVKTVAEITLALMLFHDAVRIDLRALKTGRAVPLRLLGIGLPLMIVVGAAVGYLVFPSFGLVGAALVATMLAPTDAALGEAVVSDKRVPVRIRQGLNVESGLNDGMSVPVFLVLLAIAADPAGAEPGALVIELVRQIGLGVLSGVIIGGGGGALFVLASRNELMAEQWRRIAIVALSLGCFVGAAVLGGSGFIGAFVGGLVFGVVSEARSEEDNSLTEYIGTAFDALSFLVLGAIVIPFVLPYVTWSMVLYAILSLTVIRMATVAVAMLRSGAARPTIAFMGWFGPRGLATLVFTVLVIDENIVNGDAIAAAAVIGIVLSVFAHGLSAPPLVSAYAAWWQAHKEAETSPMEGKRVYEHALGKGLTQDSENAT